MSIVTETEVIRSNNGWQNIGAMIQHAIDKGIPSKYIGVYAVMLRHSFGYKKRETEPMPMKEWAKICNMTDKTFKSHIEWLEKNKYISVMKQKGYVDKGGKIANKYRPIFVSGIDIKIEDIIRRDNKLYHKIFDEIKTEDRKKADNIIEYIKKENADRKAIGNEANADLKWYFEQTTYGKTLYLKHTDPEKYEEEVKKQKEARSKSVW